MASCPAHTADTAAGEWRECGCAARQLLLSPLAAVRGALHKDGGD